MGTWLKSVHWEHREPHGFLKYSSLSSAVRWHLKLLLFLRKRDLCDLKELTLKGSACLLKISAFKAQDVKYRCSVVSYSCLCLRRRAFFPWNRIVGLGIIFTHLNNLTNEYYVRIAAPVCQGTQETRTPQSCPTIKKIELLKGRLH